jgi:hypothetical protein
MQPCHLCGIVYDYESVPANPFKLCPGCKMPLEPAGVASVFVEAGNPSDLNDARRAANRAQLMADVDKHQEAYQAVKAARLTTAAPTVTPTGLTPA